MKIKKKKKHANRLIVVGALLIIICCIYTVIKPYEKKEQYSFTIFKDNEEKTSELKQKEKIEQQEVYLELEDIKNLFGQEIYIDETKKWIVLLSETKVVGINIEQQKMEINSVELQMEYPIIYQQDKYYLPISVLENVYNVEIKYINETNRVIIDSKSKQLISAEAKRNINIKKDKKLFSEVIETIKKGENIIVISSENDGWAKVRTTKGNIGYIKQKNLINFYTIRDDMNIEYIEENQDDITNIKELKNIKSIKLEQIQSYEAREEIIEKIVDQCVIEKINCLEFENEKLQMQDSTSYSRLRKELEIRLKEVGIRLK